VVARRLFWTVWLVLAVAQALGNAGAAQTLQLLAQNKTVRLGFISDQAPFSAASTNGAPTGYAVDLCALTVRALEARVGKLATTFVELGTSDSLQAIADGRVDLLCGAVSQTLGRRESVDFSEPIFVTGASAVVRRSAPRILRELVLGDREISPPRSLEMTPFAAIRVGVREGTTTQTLLRQAVTAGGYRASVEGFATHADGWAALESGAIDAYFADRVLLASLLAAAGSPGAVTLGPRLLTREIYAIAMRRGDADLRLIVDRALTKFYGSPDFAALLQRYFPADAADAQSQISALATPE
jgi:ABC-type amino acid transport substrate-binding protein